MLGSREQARRVYYGAVFEIKTEIPGKAQSPVWRTCRGWRESPMKKVLSFLSLGLAVLGLSSGALARTEFIFAFTRGSSGNALVLNGNPVATNFTAGTTTPASTMPAIRII
jgi:hypothetical protein